MLVTKECIELMHETNFNEIRRNKTGQYNVKLPFKSDYSFLLEHKLKNLREIPLVSNNNYKVF